MQRVELYRFPTSGPEDVSGLAALVERGTVDPASIICLLGKTEGNGCVNDFSRGYATAAYTRFLASVLGARDDEIARRVLFIMSGGTEGVMTPHMSVFAARRWPRPGSPGRPTCTSCRSSVRC